MEQGTYTLSKTEGYFWTMAWFFRCSSGDLQPGSNLQQHPLESVIKIYLKRQWKREFNVMQVHLIHLKSGVIASGTAKFSFTSRITIKYGSTYCRKKTRSEALDLKKDFS